MCCVQMDVGNMNMDVVNNPLAPAAAPVRFYFVAFCQIVLAQFVVLCLRVPLVPPYTCSPSFALVAGYGRDCCPSEREQPGKPGMHRRLLRTYIRLCSVRPFSILLDGMVSFPAVHLNA